MYHVITRRLLIVPRTREDKIARRIYLVKIQQGTVPLLLLGSISQDNAFEALEVKALSGNENYKNAVKIGKPKGLQYEAVVLINKCHKFKGKQIVRRIANLDLKTSERVMRRYRNSKPQLHKELHSIKRKIFLAQMNNENYGDLENRLQEILKELKYPTGEIEDEHRAFKGFREAPSKGPIKIYLGGR